MAASQQTVGIHVSDGASSGDIHIPANQDRADGGTGLHGLGLFGVADRTDAHDRHDASGGKLRSKELNRILGESAEHKRSFYRLEIVGKVLCWSAVQAGTRGLAWADHSRLCRYRNLRGAAVHRADLEHLRYGSDA